MTRHIFFLSSIAAASLLHGADIDAGNITVFDETAQNTPLLAHTYSYGDTAHLLDMSPGVSTNTNGGFSSFTSIHALSDDRLKYDIDGMTITSACPNHMNPALSYVDPSKIASIDAIATITPVSQGGDSIGGTITVKQKDPTFAKTGETLSESGTLSAFFRSNNIDKGVTASVTAATNTVSVTYTGMAEKAGDYTNGQGRKVSDTLFQQQNQKLSLAYKMQNGIAHIEAGTQNVPYEGFPNQYMDMTKNISNYGKLSYLGYIGETSIDANTYWRKTVHEMNFLYGEKKPYPSGVGMPMNTYSQEYGYVVKADIPLQENHILKIGSEFNRFFLTDWWPPATTTTSGMGPNEFININDAHRDRLAFFAESADKWSDRLKTTVGIRTDIVSMDTDNVQGYNQSSNLPAAQNAFNAQNHAKRDHNYDISALGEYVISPTNDVQAGVSHKTRSPNLYERYTWAYGNTMPAQMDMRMINWYGDANGYVGNVDLKPEVANTIALSSIWHDAQKQSWEVKISPYYTAVQNYIDADLLYSSNGVNYLRFANHDVIIYGVDVSAHATMWHNISYGKGTISAVGSWTRGYRTDNGDVLYNITPLNAKISLEQAIGSFTNGVDITLMNERDAANKLRNEKTTPGYGIVDLRTTYRFAKHVKIDLSITNLFNQYYLLPNGGIDIAQKNMQGGIFTQLSGEGRSFNTMLTYSF